MGLEQGWHKVLSQSPTWPSRWNEDEKGKTSQSQQCHVKLVGEVNGKNETDGSQQTLKTAKELEHLKYADHLPQECPEYYKPRPSQHLTLQNTDTERFSVSQLITAIKEELIQACANHSDQEMTSSCYGSHSTPSSLTHYHSNSFLITPFKSTPAFTTTNSYFSLPISWQCSSK
uniref:Uncharacterized protein n=1 Tax=Moniliophthora roreri TaxID=221103 RepID=A0A0W0FUW7_MONRR